MRSFQASWLKTYPWLVYSESEDGEYCKCCVLFAHLASNITTDALVKLPMKNWNEATDILKDHQKKEYHITASLRADDFLQTAERPETSITSIIDNKAARHIAKNRKLLRIIISCIVFCGKQNIALRGHNESLSDEGNNPGNFLALLKIPSWGRWWCSRRPFKRSYRSSKIHVSNYTEWTNKYHWRATAPEYCWPNTRQRPVLLDTGRWSNWRCEQRAVFSRGSFCRYWRHHPRGIFRLPKFVEDYGRGYR